jgi:membrane protease YdiL (CAAX protease family)
VGPIFWWTCPQTPVIGLSILVMVLLTPLIEEVINRGLFLQALVQRGRAQAIVVSAILFTALHRVDSMPVAFAFGVVAALQMLHYRTLWGCLIAHATFNLVAILDWDCLHGQWTPADTSLKLGVGASLLAALLLATALLLARHGSAGARGAPGH